LLTASLGQHTESKTPVWVEGWAKDYSACQAASNIFADLNLTLAFPLELLLVVQKLFDLIASSKCFGYYIIDGNYFLCSNLK